MSCTAEAQTRFERAVALLHSFWYEKAADTFRHFAHALGAARTGDTAGARSAISALDDIERTEGAAGGAHAYWAGQVRIQTWR